VRKFVYVNGILNVGPEIADLLEDEYTHGDLLKQLGEYQFGDEGQGFGVIEGDVARIDVDADGLDDSLEQLGFEVRRIKLINRPVIDDDGELDDEFDDADPA
jgi:hypothetical protein